MSNGHSFFTKTFLKTNFLKSISSTKRFSIKRLRKMHARQNISNKPKVCTYSSLFTDVVIITQAMIFFMSIIELLTGAVV